MTAVAYVGPSAQAARVEKSFPDSVSESVSWARARGEGVRSYKSARQDGARARVPCV